MTDGPNRVTLFAKTNFRGEETVFGIREPDRRAHMYVIGQTGTGKSTLLESLMRSDLEAGGGFALIDPHGDLVDRVRRLVPASRRADLIDFDVPTRIGQLGFNPLEGVRREARPLAASQILDTMKKIWVDSWGPRMEHILRNALFTLLDQPEASLADLPRLLTDYAFRRAALVHVQSQQVRDFWLGEFAQYPDRLRAEAVAPVLNKVGALLADPVLYAIFTSPSSFAPRQVMDEGRILLVNLSKGRIGGDSAALLGALIVSSLGLAGLSRADVPEDHRLDFAIYLDEFQNVTTRALATLLPELRKYHVGFVLAHQYLGQLEPELQEAILGNVGTKIAFRLGSMDAEIFAKEFGPVFSPRDLMALPNYHIYLRLMIDGTASAPFSAMTCSPNVR